MCGLLGYCGQPKEGHWGETYRLLTALFLESQVRGTDASGYSAVTDDFKGKSRHRVMFAKQPVPAAQFVRGTAWRKLWHHRCCSLIAHCRFATTGSADRNINNHPHGNPKGKYFLIHNGHIRNWQAVADKHRLRLKSQCDSEVILRLAERAKHPALGLADALAACDGSMAVVLQDIKHAGLLWLVRNYGSPLWLMRLEGDRRFFFASTRSILVRSFSKVLGGNFKDDIDLLMPLSQYCVHGLSPQGGLVAVSD